METRILADLIRYSDEKMQKNSLFDSANCFCDVYCLKPGQDQRVHTHAGSDKVYIVLRGRGLFHIGGEERELVEGQAVIARPGEPHGVKNAGAEDLAVLVFMAPRPS
ncbi:MAG TPA: cupin domain-containing protein [Terriglobia bacterium]|nr:cupin domain-containing protein [Terriglobia bacterium]